MNGCKKWLGSRLLFLLIALFLCDALFCTSSFAATADRIAGALASSSSVTLRGNVQRNALPKFDQGLADPTLRFGSIMMVTVPTASQREDLTRLLEEQQDRKSESYHKWLTPEQYGDRFGLSANDVSKITGWLKSQGFQNVQTARGRNWFMFSGTAAQVQRAFGTEIHRYKVDGEMHVANATSPKIPSALSGIVVGIRGLDDFHLQPRTLKKINPNYYSSSLQTEFLAPGDVATIYDINSLYTNGFDGTGEKLAVIGQTDIYLADLTDFRTAFGLSSISCTTNSNNVISACSDPHFTYMLVSGVTDPLAPRSEDLAEADLDIEISGSVARGANIVYVNAPVTYNGTTIVSGGAWDSWYYAVDNDVAPVITMSYGTCEFFDTNILTSSGAAGADETELQKANTEGITFLNASGDSGPTECDNPMNNNPNNEAAGGIAVAYPASSPEVTAVGGTSVSLANFNSTYFGTTNGTDGGSALGYVPEQVWNDDEEIADYCSGANASSDFCTQGGSSPVSGWVPITSAATAQADVGMLASGGGPSNCAELTPGGNQCVAGFPQPSYQASLSLSGQAAARFTPDVAMLASPDFPGYIICTNVSVLGDGGSGSACANGIPDALALPFPPIYGGTSVSTPLFAGIVTIMNQYTGSTGQGNINSTLYTLAATPSNKVFNAIVTSGASIDATDNDVHCEAGTGQIPCPSSGVAGFAASNADATTGYNLVTGLGSVDVGNLATALGSSTSGSFTIAPQNPSYTVSQGQNLSVTVVLTPVNGFNTAVTYTCTDPASESTCTGPTGPTNAASVSFQITTTAATSELRRPMDRGSRIMYATLLPGLLGIVFTLGSRKRSLRGMRMLGLILVVGCSTMWLGSCGGSSSSSGNPGTPKQAYTFNVSATTGGNNAITSQTSFQVTVQ